MKITVELTGLARAITGQKILAYDLPPTVTYRDLVRLLGQSFPQLIGLLIDQDGVTFLSSNLFIINGDMATPAMIMDESPREGDHLILMSVITGG
jgi:hypothetical protein